MNYKKEIQKAFKDHGVKNEELENALNDLFIKFEGNILSSSFIDKIDKELKVRADRRNKAWGG